MEGAAVAHDGLTREAQTKAGLPVGWRAAPCLLPAFPSSVSSGALKSQLRKWDCRLLEWPAFWLQGCGDTDLLHVCPQS